MKQVKIFTLAVCAILSGCASGGPAKDPGSPAAGKSGPDSTAPGAILGVDWLLLEIRRGDTVIDLDRPKLAAEERGGFFSLRFEEADGETRLSGEAAPNRYFGPCSWGAGGVLSIGLLASTKIMALNGPESLKEHEFFGYLSRAGRWALGAGDRLELFSAAEDGAEAVMVFGKAL